MKVLKVLIKVLKTFIKSFEAPHGSVKIKIQVNIFFLIQLIEMQGAGKVNKQCQISKTDIHKEKIKHKYSENYIYI